MTGTDRLVPSDLQAESALLGAIILQGEVNSLQIDGSYFFRPAHCHIFHACFQLQTQGILIDLVTLRQQLQKNDTLEKVGGQDYLVELCETCPSTASREHYARIVAEKHVARQAISFSDRIKEQAYSSGCDVQKLSESIVDQGVTLRRELSKNTNEDVTITSIASEVVSDAQKPPEGIPTPFSGLNEAICCLEPGAVYTLAAYTGQGKSSLALNITAHACSYTDVIYFSLEMPPKQLARRLMCSDTRIPIKQARLGNIDKDQAQQLRASLDKYQNLRIIYDSMSVRGMEQRIKHHKGSKPKLIVVDYLQLLTGREKSLREQVVKNSRDIKLLAGKYDLAVIQVSQLRRPAERHSKPHLYMLKESGSIEQDSDCVMMIGEPDDDVISTSTQGRTEERYLNIEKSRDGATTNWGDIRLKWHPTITRFED